MNKKSVTLNIISKLIQWLPIAIYGCFNIKDFYKDSKSGITVTAIFLLIAVLFYFKDSVKDWISHPSTFKFICISWVFSLIFIFLGEKLFVVSTILLASFLVSVPIEVWRKHVKKEATESKVIQDLKDMLLGK